MIIARRSSWLWIAGPLTVLAWPGNSGCGRVGFDDAPPAGQTGGDATTNGGDANEAPLTLSPATPQLNVNGTLTFTGTGGSGSHLFSIASGQGTIDAVSGLFTAPHYAGETVVRVSDDDGQIAETTVTAGGMSLFVFGGWGGYTTDQGYHSPDGILWTPEDLDGGRGETVTVVFNDRMYLVGGWFGGVNISSVMVSDTGASGSWTLAGNLPEPRGWGSAVVLDHRIIYAGGRGAGWANADVYASDDGEIWVQIGDLPETSTWGGLAVFNGMLWHLGGDHGAAGISDAIYTSSTGALWQIATETLPAPRAGGAVQVLDDRLWYIAGTDQGGSPQDQVWNSADGTTWLDTGGVLPAALTNPASTVHAGEIWIIGGNTGSFVDSVYHSSDGLSWQTGTPLPETLDRFSTVTFTPP